MLRKKPMVNKPMANRTMENKPLNNKPLNNKRILNKRFVHLLLLLLILVVFTGSAKLLTFWANKNTVLVDSFKDENTLRIIMPYNYYRFSAGNNTLGFIQKAMFKSFGTERLIKIEVVEIAAETYDQYLMVRNNYLYQKNGPELIFVDLENEAIDYYVDQGIAMKIGDRIPNQEFLYSPLVDDYFLPIGMARNGLVADVRVLNEIGAPIPSFDWTIEDYNAISDIWGESYEINMNLYVYFQMYNQHFAGVEMMDEFGQIQVNTPEMLKIVKALRDDVHGSRYVIDYSMPSEEYKGMLLDGESELNAWRMVRGEKRWIKLGNANLLHPIENYYGTALEDNILLPDIFSKNRDITQVGFIVNYNGKNLELAFSALNALLSKESQLDLYLKKLGIAPVSNQVEEEIQSGLVLNKNLNNLKVPELYIDIWSASIEALKSGQLENVDNDPVLMAIWERHFLATVDMIFNDYFFTDDELKEQLKRLENECTILSNE